MLIGLAKEDLTEASDFGLAAVDGDSTSKTFQKRKVSSAPALMTVFPSGDKHIPMTLNEINNYKVKNLKNCLYFECLEKNMQRSCIFFSRHQNTNNFHIM